MNLVEIALKHYENAKMENEVICFKINNLKHDIEIACVIPNDFNSIEKALGTIDENIFFITLKNTHFGIISNLDSSLLLMFKFENNKWLDVNIDDYQAAENMAKI